MKLKLEIMLIFYIYLSVFSFICIHNKVYPFAVNESCKIKIHRYNINYIHPYGVFYSQWREIHLQEKSKRRAAKKEPKSKGFESSQKERSKTTFIHSGQKSKEKIKKKQKEI